MENLTKSELSFLNKLSTPIKIQDYLDGTPFNYEEKGETCMSAVRVIREKKADCIEGAFLAALALMIQGERPRVVNLKVRADDFDHIITLYKRNGYWGAISKTAHAVLRFRDPVYTTVRELVMSYFHEYFLTENGEKTLIGYSRIINLNRFGDRWIAHYDDVWDIAEEIFDAPITKIIPKGSEKYIKDATELERKVAGITLAQEV